MCSIRRRAGGSQHVGVTAPGPGAGAAPGSGRDRIAQGSSGCAERTRRQPRVAPGGLLQFTALLQSEE